MNTRIISHCTDFFEQLMETNRQRAGLVTFVQTRGEKTCRSVGEGLQNQLQKEGVSATLIAAPTQNSPSFPGLSLLTGLIDELYGTGSFASIQKRLELPQLTEELWTADAKDFDALLNARVWQFNPWVWEKATVQFSQELLTGVLTKFAESDHPRSLIFVAPPLEDAQIFGFLWQLFEGLSAQPMSRRTALWFVIDEFNKDNLQRAHLLQKLFTLRDRRCSTHVFPFPNPRAIRTFLGETCPPEVSTQELSVKIILHLKQTYGVDINETQTFDPYMWQETIRACVDMPLTFEETQEELELSQEILLGYERLSHLFEHCLFQEIAHCVSESVIPFSEQPPLVQYVYLMALNYLSQVDRAQAENILNDSHIESAFVKLWLKCGETEIEELALPGTGYLFCYRMIELTRACLENMSSNVIIAKCEQMAEDTLGNTSLRTVNQFLSAAKLLLEDITQCDNVSEILKQMGSEYPSVFNAFCQYLFSCIRMGDHSAPLSRLFERNLAQQRCYTPVENLLHSLRAKAHDMVNIGRFEKANEVLRSCLLINEMNPEPSIEAALANDNVYIHLSGGILPLDWKPLLTHGARKAKRSRSHKILQENSVLWAQAVFHEDGPEACLDFLEKLPEEQSVDAQEYHALTLTLLNLLCNFQQEAQQNPALKPIEILQRVCSARPALFGECRRLANAEGAEFELLLIQVIETFLKKDETTLELLLTALAEGALQLNVNTIRRAWTLTALARLLPTHLGSQEALWRCALQAFFKILLLGWRQESKRMALLQSPVGQSILENPRKLSAMSQDMLWSDFVKNLCTVTSPKDFFSCAGRFLMTIYRLSKIIFRGIDLEYASAQGCSVRLSRNPSFVAYPWACEGLCFSEEYNTVDAALLMIPSGGDYLERDIVWRCEPTEENCVRLVYPDQIVIELCFTDSPAASAFAAQINSDLMLRMCFQSLFLLHHQLISKQRIHSTWIEGMEYSARRTKRTLELNALLAEEQEALRYTNCQLAQTAEREKALLKEQARLDHLKKIATLSIGIGHELTNPLQIMHLSIEELEDELEHAKNSEQLRARLRALKSSLTRVAEGVKRLDQFKQYATEKEARGISIDEALQTIKSR